MWFCKRAAFDLRGGNVSSDSGDGDGGTAKAAVD